MKQNYILLVDGNLLMYKSFYSTYYQNPNNLLKNSQGIPTQGIHIFFTTLLSVIQNFNISHCFIAFDAGSQTSRHEFFADYKANRAKAPDDLFVQMEIVKKLLTLMNIKIMQQPLVEADDLIASLALKAKKDPENEIFILSADQDLLQLVQDNISIIYRPKNSYVYDLKTINNFYELHQIHPNQVIDYKAIAGDVSDNLPGVKGIGEKTAKKLLNEYPNLEAIYENLYQLSPKMQEKFLESKEVAFLCKKLATLNYHVVLDLEIKDLALDITLNQTLEAELNQLELNKIKTLILGKNSY
ncbi:5'-3' exonuclease [Candidatus Mycoplasma pogonae]